MERGRRVKHIRNVSNMKENIKRYINGRFSQHRKQDLEKQLEFTAATFASIDAG
jgi:hypothetical protein